MKPHQFLGLAALCLGTKPALASEPPDGLAVSGSLRMRYETIDGQPRSGFNPSDQLVESRLTLLFALRHGNLQLATEIYDSRAWNANPGTPLGTNEVNAFEPVQAYVQADLGSLLGQGTATTAQIGRFMLNAGSRRLIASDDYRNTTNAYTGLHVEIRGKSGVKFTGLYVLPQTRLPDDGPALRANTAQIDKESLAAVAWGGFLAHQARGSPLLVEASFLHFGEHDAPGRPTRDRSLNNLGGRIESDPRPGQFDWGVEAIAQWGRISASAAANAAILPVTADFERLHLGYSFAAPWHPHLLAELDRGSGGSGPDYHRFDTLFGFRRGDLALSGLYNAITRTNTISPGLRLEVAPSPRLDGFIGYRAFWLADRFDAFSTTNTRDATGASGRFAGHQIDTRLRYWLVPAHLRLEADVAVLAKGRFLRTAPNANTSANTLYTSVNLTASF